MNLFPWKNVVFAALIGSGLLCSAPAYAAITEMQPLSFGTWAIIGNTGFKYITVQPNGAYSNSAGVVNLTPVPQPGMYRVDSLPPFTAINSINVTMLTPMQGGNQDFNMDTFQIVYDPTTNGSGEMNITLGCTARTTGSGIPYDDAVYNGTLQLDINY